MAELWPREPRHIPLWQQIGRGINYHRWAGLSGATAIVFTAYLENDVKLSNADRHFISLANQINYIHALVLLAMPIARRPNLVSANSRSIENLYKFPHFCLFFLLIVGFPFLARNVHLLSWMLFLRPIRFQWIPLFEFNWWNHIDRCLVNVSLLRCQMFYRMS